MSTAPSRKMFVNLPVRDLKRSVDFFTKLGFTFEPRFTDENATCTIVGEDAFVMLLGEEAPWEEALQEEPAPTPGRSDGQPQSRIRPNRIGVWHAVFRPDVMGASS